MKSLVLKSRELHGATRFGRWQVVLLCLALLAVGATVFLYVQIKRMENLGAVARAQFGRNLNELKKLEELVAKIEADEEIQLPTPDSIRTSLVKFEDEFLAPTEEADLAVIREINQLAERSGVVLSEINFDLIEQTALEGEAAPGAAQRAVLTAAKSLFPGLEMSFTVEGGYADVRQLLIALERSRSFLIINSLDLKSVEQSASRGGTRLSRGAATDQVIALGIKLSVYYQREDL